MTQNRVRRSIISAPASEFEELLEKAEKLTEKSVNHILMECGYTPPALVHWRKTNIFPQKAHMALIGYCSLYEQQATLNKNEIIDLMKVTNKPELLRKLAFML